MTSEVLWRRISPTDFNAINGNASPEGRGGGAMHIALGVRSARLPIDQFLGINGASEATILAHADRNRTISATLSFDGNPQRRGGEWRIRDQYTHRHPAWSSSHGFPETYDPRDPPYILVVKAGRTFHARFLLESDLKKLPVSVLPKGIFASTSGISIAKPDFAAALEVPSITRLEEFHEQEEAATEEPFDPKSLADGRERIIGAVIRRLGQQAFRRKLLAAYASRCAITNCKVPLVLEAAHISPYRGIRTNAVTNGLLLRADIHTLFDLGLISIEPSRFTVQISKILAGSEYERFQGERIFLPMKTDLHPSAIALEYHFQRFHP